MKKDNQLKGFSLHVEKSNELLQVQKPIKQLQKTIGKPGLKSTYINVTMSVFMHWCDSVNVRWYTAAVYFLE